MSRTWLLGVAALTIILCAIGTLLYCAMSGLAPDRGLERFWFQALGVICMTYLTWVNSPPKPADSEPTTLPYEFVHVRADGTEVRAADMPAGTPVVEPMRGAEAEIHEQYSRERTAAALSNAGVEPTPPASGMVDAAELRTRLEVIRANRVADPMARVAIEMCMGALDVLASEGAPT